MCGRFTLMLDANGLQVAFPTFTPPPMVAPRYNIAPTQPVLAIANDGKSKIDFFLWGLIPSWAKDPSMGARMINARAETLAEKPSFKNAYKRRRCLIPADGFYEWQKGPDSKDRTPMFIHRQDRQPFAFAGLWETWHPGDENILSCAIITTTANPLMAPIHDRMPVILPQSAWEEWLDPVEQPPAELDKFLRPYPANEMAAYPVSTLVNSAANDRPECVLPA
ncbi:MAG: SOS response-associated peptidase [Anaerolineae bacterium]|nr:SOS response-associated peptidase [Anaerolineae bacterium]